MHHTVVRALMFPLPPEETPGGHTTPVGPVEVLPVPRDPVAIEVPVRRLRDRTGVVPRRTGSPGPPGGTTTPPGAESATPAPGRETPALPPGPPCRPSGPGRLDGCWLVGSRTSETQAARSTWPVPPP